MQFNKEILDAMRKVKRLAGNWNQGTWFVQPVLLSLTTSSSLHVATLYTDPSHNNFLDCYVAIIVLT